MSGARSRERAVRDIRFRRARWCLSADGSCSRRTGHPFAASGFLGPSQKIELVFSASPETIRRSLRRSALLRSVGNRQDLAVCASMILFLSYQGSFLRCSDLPLLGGNKLAILPIHGQQPCHHLAGYGQRGSVPVALLHRLLVDQSQLRALTRRQLRSLHQHALDMLVALF